MEANVWRDARLVEDEASSFDGDVHATRPSPAGVPVRARLAYLVNVYPKISHSFIHTEIEALERAGLKVDRFTVRRSPEASPDGDEQAEAARTTALLDGNRRGLTVAVLRSLIAHPRLTLSTLAHAVKAHGAQGLVRSLAYFVEATALAQALDQRGINHIHVHFGTNSVAVARLAARMTPVSYSFTAHGPDEFDAPHRLDLKGKIAEAAFVVGVSDYGRGQLLRWADLAHWGRVHVVRCAVARHFLSGEAQSTGDVSRRLVCVARLSAQKGLPLLIEAVARIPRERTFTLDIIGDGEDRAILEAHIARLGVADRIRLLGWCAPDRVRQELQGARALVLPSFAEGLPVVLMEALAVGRPVIATAIAGIPELVDDSNGWLIPCGSVEALAEAMNAVLDATPERLQAMGEVGRARVAAMHDPDINAGKLAGLLRPFL
ncbi:glycosyltransferase [Sphingobium aromaticiconvertens]|uniref:glycosyltransferase n=1 Tax=Sphingobium aromaticiconvertens TaxID=365341 RepID=UPI0030191E5F